MIEINSVKTPKVTVCIPTYNYSRYLTEALESVLSQTYTDFELLVIDDHSPDDSAVVIENYARRDKRIVFSVNDRNLGMVANWNLCLTRARGEYVRFLFGDDYLVSPDTLGMMVEVLDRNPAVVLTGSARLIVDELSATKRIVSRFSDHSRYQGPDVVRRSLLEERNLIGEPSAVMFRRLDALRGFDAAYRQLVDLEMWFHLLGQGDYYHLATPLVAFREHDEQQTVHNARDGVLIDELIRLNADFGLRSPADNSFWRWFLACQAYQRHRQWASERISSAAAWRLVDRSELIPVGPLHCILYRLLKPLLKVWFQCCTGKVR